MGNNSNIAWCDDTANYVLGCDKVSAGCKNCYITTTPYFKFYGMKHGDARVKSKGAVAQVLAANRKPWVCNGCGTPFETPHDAINTVDGCFHLQGFHRRRIFSCSLSDWLDDQWEIAWLAEMLNTIRLTPEVDHLLCSKRLEFWDARAGEVADYFGQKHSPGYCPESLRWLQAWRRGAPPVNVWMIGSAENQEMLEKRSKELMAIPAVVRGLSCEPLLEHIDLKLDESQCCGTTAKKRDWPINPRQGWTECPNCYSIPKRTRQIDWVIAGGESGKDARPCNIEWIRSIKNQCEAAGVPFFGKQLGSNAWMPQDEGGEKSRGKELTPFKTKHPKGGDPDEWPSDLRVRQFPKSCPR